MQITGEYSSKAHRAEVWTAFMSPDALRAAIPGCQEFEEIAPAEYRVTVKVSIAAITGVYKGTVAVRDPKPMASYKLVVDGSGKAGRVQASADLTFSDQDGGALIRYAADIKPQGAIARLGNRLIASAANLLIGQFFKAMERRIEGD